MDITSKIFLIVNIIRQVEIIAIVYLFLEISKRKHTHFPIGH